MRDSISELTRNGDGRVEKWAETQKMVYCRADNQIRRKEIPCWVNHDNVTSQAVWLPFARAVLLALAHTPLTVVPDTSTARRRWPRQVRS
jgi:hypothetical protein